jgi:hypothetical protein
VLHLHAVRQQKIGSEDVENAIQTPPARFGSPFSLILGLMHRSKKLPAIPNASDCDRAHATFERAGG